MPIFTLVDQEGRLFKPLAWAKTLTMIMAALLAITLDPAVRMLFARMEPIHIRWPWRRRQTAPSKGEAVASKLATGLLVGTYYEEEKPPVSKVLFRVYEPACRWMLKRRRFAVLIAAVLSVWGTVNLASMMFSVRLPGTLIRGFEFMPPLWEGTILYMPTTLPGISVTEAQALMQKQDQILKSFPEVERVFGKSGRMESSTDPAPFSMMETIVLLKPEHEWRKVTRWYSGLPDVLKGPLRPFWSDHISYEQLIDEMDRSLKIVGVTNAWTMPIKNRIDMLTTGVRTPIGIKIFGADVKKIEELGTHLEMILKDVKGTRSIYAERVTGGTEYF